MEELMHRNAAALRVSLQGFEEKKQAFLHNMKYLSQGMVLPAFRPLRRARKPKIKSPADGEDDEPKPKSIINRKPRKYMPPKESVYMNFIDKKPRLQRVRRKLQNLVGLQFMHDARKIKLLQILDLYDEQNPQGRYEFSFGSCLASQPLFDKLYQWIDSSNKSKKKHYSSQMDHQTYNIAITIVD